MNPLRSDAQRDFFCAQVNHGWCLADFWFVFSCGAFNSELWINMRSDSDYI